MCFFLNKQRAPPPQGLCREFGALRSGPSTPLCWLCCSLFLPRGHTPFFLSPVLVALLLWAFSLLCLLCRRPECVAEGGGGGGGGVSWAPVLSCKEPGGGPPPVLFSRSPQCPLGAGGERDTGAKKRVCSAISRGSPVPGAPGTGRAEGAGHDKTPEKSVWFATALCT